MPRIIDIGCKKDHGGHLMLDDGQYFVFAREPEAIFHLGGCVVFTTETELILADCVIAHIDTEKRLTFEDDKFVFQAIQEFRRKSNGSLLDENDQPNNSGG